MTEHDVAIVGAGPAGVSVALSLRDRGLRPLLIDRADQVASSWRSRYDRLKLNTGRPFSHLPNRPYPKGTAMFPTRDDVVAHLDRHAGEDGIELRLGSEAQRIERTTAVGASAPPRATSTRRATGKTASGSDGSPQTCLGVARTVGRTPPNVEWRRAGPGGLPGDDPRTPAATGDLPHYRSGRSDRPRARGARSLGISASSDCRFRRGPFTRDAPISRCAEPRRPRGHRRCQESIDRGGCDGRRRSTGRQGRPR